MKDIFDSPTDSNIYDNEFDNRIHIVYYYENSIFEFSDDCLVSFDIVDKKYFIEPLNVHVGNHLDINSVQRFNATIDQCLVKIPVKNSDNFLQLELNQEREITRIFYVVYW